LDFVQPFAEEANTVGFLIKIKVIIKMKNMNTLPHNPSTILHDLDERSHVLYRKDIGNEPYVKHHTIILDSRDRRSGSTLIKAVFDMYKATPVTSPKAVMFVDSFLINDATVFNNCFYFIKIKEVAQPLSYYSGNKSMTDVVVCNKGATYFNNNGLGMVPLYDKGVFQGKPLTIELTCPDADISALASNWVLKLVILEEPYENNP
jgi:hypothetical protein